MAYILEAFVADEAMLRGKAFPGAKVVSLPQGKALLPLVADLRRRFGIETCPLTERDENERPIPSGLLEIAKPLVKLGKLAYIEAMFFGGDGIQACVLWDGDEAPALNLVDTHAINHALKFIGVRVGDHHDEFDALGLGSYRSTDEWL